jgi:hypothetical protein
MMVGAKLARGDLDRVWSGAWKRAIGISVVVWSISTGDRLVDWRGCAEIVVYFAIAMSRFRRVISGG